MSNHVLKSGQRALVRDLRQLLQDRAQRHEQIHQQHTTQTAAIDREETARRQSIQSAYDHAVKDAQHTHDEELAEARQLYQQKKTLIKKAYEDDRSTLHSRSEENIEEARRQRDEQIWLAESVYEGSQQLPHDDYQRDLDLIQSRTEEVKDLRAAAIDLLARARMASVTRQHTTDAQATTSQEANPSHEMEKAVEHAHHTQDELANIRLLNLSRGITPIFILILAIAVGFGADWLLWSQPQRWVLVAVIPAITAAALLIAYIIARRRAANAWRQLNNTVNQVISLKVTCVDEAKIRRDNELNQLRATRDREVREARERCDAIVNEIRARAHHRLSRIDTKYPALLQKYRANYRQSLNAARQKHTQSITHAQQTRDTEIAALEADLQHRRAALDSWHNSSRASLESDWKTGTTRAYELLTEIQQSAAATFPPWDAASWENWSPPYQFAPAITLGSLHIDLEQFPGGLPQDQQQLPLPGPATFTLPATLAFPDRCSLLIQREGDDAGSSVRVLQNAMMRILTCVPPGKARFTIIDPVGLGQNFAGFMHLADYNDALIGGKIWTEPRHIEQRLTDLTEHMENVIQKYLRNEYHTIDQYNQQAGEIAEPYRFLVLADFPANFTDNALKRLASIISSGARCGVHTLIAMDTRQKLPDGFDLDDLYRTCLTIRPINTANNTPPNADNPSPEDQAEFRLLDDDFAALPLQLEQPPHDALMTRLVNLVGKESIDASRVEVPFDVIAPDDDELWSWSSQDEFRVALGRSGATKLQYLSLGHGTAQHALIAGKTGSGKSTLLHALVTNLALWYNPDEVELYLIDFKKGVEFKTYATHRLPHLRALAIESDREFGVSVLQRVDQELQRRGERFRQLGVQDLAGFRAAAPDEPLPRTLLVIDEFQELFTEDDRLAQDASLLLDRLVRQGRAFGIHVLLGSQTLGGAYSLARSTIGQMAVRIALQCSEADSYLILSDDNAAARLLSRPGEAIYNDASGQLQGNSPFQVVWLPEHVRERQLARIKNLPHQRPQSHPPIIFEGNVPGDILKNSTLCRILNGNDQPPTGGALAWLGDPVAIKDPTAARFRQQSGHNLLIVGQREDAAQAMLIASIVSIAAQSPRARFVLFDGSIADTHEAQQWRAFAEYLQPQLEHVSLQAAPQAVQNLADILHQRQQHDHAQADPVYVLIYGLHRFRDLRHIDDFSFSASDAPPTTDKLFADLLREGPLLGIHTIAWCDTANNINRTLERQSLREFEMRVLFQMSATDSALLIDNPAAATLGHHRALYYSEEEGRQEKFRPYASPPQQWLQEVTRHITAHKH